MFEQTLKKERGFVIKKMESDGACLFRAIGECWACYPLTIGECWADTTSELCSAENPEGWHDQTNHTEGTHGGIFRIVENKGRYFFSSQFAIQWQHQNGCCVYCIWWEMWCGFVVWTLRQAFNVRTFNKVVMLSYSHK